MDFERGTPTDRDGGLARWLKGVLPWQWVLALAVTGGALGMTGTAGPTPAVHPAPPPRGVLMGHPVPLTAGATTRSISGKRRPPAAPGTASGIPIPAGATIGALNGTVLWAAPGAGTISVQLTGTWVATVAFEASNDPTGTTWAAVKAINESSDAIGTSTTANGVFLLPGGFLQYRLRASAYTSGTITPLVYAGDGANVTRLLAGGSGGGVAADTELPAAAALADATANPTTPVVGGMSHGYNGATWDRLRTVGAATGTTGTGLLGVGNLLWDAVGGVNFVKQAGDGSGRAIVVGPVAIGAAATGTMPLFMGGADAAQNMQQIRVYGSVADNTAAAVQGVFTNSENLLYNGTGFDKVRNNVDAIFLTSAARTTTQGPTTITTYNAKGIDVYVNVTSAGTGSITLSILGVDPVSGGTYTILAGAAITTNSMNVYKVYPGLTAAANQVANDHVPRNIALQVTANNANSVTYSCGYTLLY